MKTGQDGYRWFVGLEVLPEEYYRHKTGAHLEFQDSLSKVYKVYAHSDFGLRATTRMVEQLGGELVRAYKSSLPDYKTFFTARFRAHRASSVIKRVSLCVGADVCDIGLVNEQPNTNLPTTGG